MARIGRTVRLGIESSKPQTPEPKHQEKPKHHEALARIGRAIRLGIESSKPQTPKPKHQRKPKHQEATNRSGRSLELGTWPLGLEASFPVDRGEDQMELLGFAVEPAGVFGQLGF